MSVRPGFDGLVRVGSWLPLELVISNKGPDISGELEVLVDGTRDLSTFDTPPVVQSTAAVLPRFSEKRFVLDAYVPTASSRVTARLKADGKVIVERAVPLDPMPSGEILCGLLSRSSAALEFLPTVTLTARQYSARLAKLDLVDLPTKPQVLSSLGCLIMSNPPNGTLDDAQIGALETWVSQGGLLIVTGGPNWQNVAANLPAHLLPVTITGTSPLQSLTGLARFAQKPITDPGPWLATRAQVTSGTVVVQEGDLPILVASRRGMGGVFYLALDPASEPLRSWAGNAFLWRYMLSHVPAAAASPGSPSQQYSGWGSVPRRALADIAGADLPDPQPLAILVFGYALLLAPIAYLGIRRARRPGLTAVLLGLAVLTASASSFAVAAANRDADLIVNKITLVRAWDERSPASTRTYVSLFGSRDAQYDVIAPRDSLMHGLLSPSQPFGSSFGNRGQNVWTLQVVNGDAPTARGYSLMAGRMGTLTIDGTAPALQVAADLTVSNGVLTGAVSNRSDRVLENAALVVGRQVIKLATLSPGQTQRLAANLDGTAPPTYAGSSDLVEVLMPRLDDDEAQLREKLDDILESALDVDYLYYHKLDLNAVTLVSWLNDSRVPVQVRDTKIAELERTLLVMTLPLRFTPGQQVVIPSDMIDRRPLAVNVGSKLESSSFTLAVGESASSEFTLPLPLGQLDVDSLTLNIEGSVNDRSDLAASQAVGSTFLFDWQRADWTEVRVGLGKNVIADAGRFVSPLGTVRVRYTFRPPTDSGFTRLWVTRFDITVGGRAR